MLRSLFVMVLFGTIPLDGVLCEIITYFFLMLHSINSIKQMNGMATALVSCLNFTQCFSKG